MFFTNNCFILKDCKVYTGLVCRCRDIVYCLINVFEFNLRTKHLLKYSLVTLCVRMCKRILTFWFTFNVFMINYSQYSLVLAKKYFWYFRRILWSHQRPRANSLRRASFKVCYFYARSTSFTYNSSESFWVLYRSSFKLKKIDD